jgi:hypothetical protein
MLRAAATCPIDLQRFSSSVGSSMRHGRDMTADAKQNKSEPAKGRQNAPP